MFTYTSIQTHGIHTPEGKKIKETEVRVSNGKGIKRVSISDNHGIHTNTMPLNSREIKNIQTHKFMPTLFTKQLKVVRHKKNQTRRTKNRTRKHK
jgi:hypothetical protein